MANKFQIEEMFLTKPVALGFVTSEGNLDLVFGSQRYWVRYKIKYAKGNLVMFERFTPEGSISYTIDELKADTGIYTLLNVPLVQNWYIQNDFLYNRNKKPKISLIRLDDLHFKEENGEVIYKIQK